ncbi:MAG: dTMP kinase [Deltaproteobacteria bacterium]|jgi:dTMP kinase|nr:dTMP kinase [Deltaproteobacteria bacterium]
MSSTDDIRGKSYFFAFEGLDGSGKSTQSHLLFEYLCSVLDVKPLLLREPSEGPAGQFLREMTRSSAPPPDPFEEMSLFLDDRDWDVNNNILPAMNGGRCVILDRYLLSNVAYQGARGGLESGAILEANRHFPAPNLTFLLQIPLETTLRRIRDRGGASPNFEAKSYLARVKEIYDSLDYPGLVRIDASAEEEETHLKILRAVRDFEPSLVPDLA